MISALTIKPERAWKIFALAAPIVIAMLTQTFINVVDTFFVGKLDPSVATPGQAALGFALPLLWIFGGSVSALGVAMSYFAFLCRAQLSATSFTIVGNACKVITVLINVSIWDKHATPLGLCCLFWCLVAAALYKQAPMRPLRGEAEPLMSEADVGDDEDSADEHECDMDEVGGHAKAKDSGPDDGDEESRVSRHAATASFLSGLARFRRDPLAARGRPYSKYAERACGPVGADRGLHLSIVSICPFCLPATKSNPFPSIRGDTHI